MIEVCNGTELHVVNKYEEWVDYESFRKKYVTSDLRKKDIIETTIDFLQGV